MSSTPPNNPENDDGEPSASPANTPPSTQPSPTGGVPVVLTPSPTSSSNDIARSNLSANDKRLPTGRTKLLFADVGRIHKRTRQMMRGETKTMLIVASRGYGRAGHVPTKRTKPVLYRRRYSIDVLTKNLNFRLMQGRGITAPIEETVTAENDDETELPVTTVTMLDLPDPSRYFNDLRSAYDPPFNEEIYLELGDATIRNDAFHYISTTGYTDSNEAWMRGESIDMALEVLRRDTNCPAYSIDIANSNSGQVFYLAAMCGNGSGKEYDMYRDRFYDKRWIFVVINDAFGGVESNGTKGTHWSLIAMNRNDRIVHYYDSLFMEWKGNRRIGADVGKGLLHILNEDISTWTFSPEWHSPHQSNDNMFEEDIGPCGPFVYKMTEVLIHHIELLQDQGKESECSLNLRNDFREGFKLQFHSQQVRVSIKAAIARWKCRVDSQNRIDYHDQIAVHDETTLLWSEYPETTITPTASFESIQRQISDWMRRRDHPRTPSPRCEGSVESQNEGMLHGLVDGVLGESEISEPAANIVLDSADPKLSEEAVVDDSDEEDHGISLIEREAIANDPNLAFAADQPDAEDSQAVSTHGEVTTKTTSVS